MWRVEPTWFPDRLEATVDVFAASSTLTKRVVLAISMVPEGQGTRLSSKSVFRNASPEDELGAIVERWAAGDAKACPFS